MVGDVAVAPVASVTITESVWLPIKRFLVFQLYDAVVPVTVCVETRVPSIESLKVFELPEAPVTDMPTLTVPLTVAPLAGLVIVAAMFDTVTFTLAVAVRPAPSTAVTVMVCAPFDTRVVSHASEVGCGLLAGVDGTT